MYLGVQRAITNNEGRTKAMKQLKCDFLKEVRTNLNIGFPFTPAWWSGDERYYDVLKVFIPNDQPMFVMGSKEDLINLKNEAMAGNPVILKTIDEDPFYLNLAHVTKIVPLRIVERDLYSQNHNFEGEYRCRWLIPEGAEAEFFDDYDRNSERGR